MQLQYDPVAARAALASADATMGRLIETIGTFALEQRMSADPFEALLRSIVYQQLSGKAAGTIHGRVLAHFENAKPSPEALLQLDDASLRGAGLSANKVLAVRDLAAKILDGTVPDRNRLLAMTDAEVIERLIAVRGIGRWTAEMLLIFSLGRPDVLPVHDLGVRKGFASTYDEQELPKPKALADYGQRWAPYRSVAAWYLWRATEL